VEVTGELGNFRQVHRLIGDPLEVKVDVQERRQESQVGRDRGLQREQVEDAPLDIHIEPVHHVVALDHLVADSWRARPSAWVDPSGRVCEPHQAGRLPNGGRQLPVAG
jgi:hypothetical protein